MTIEERSELEILLKEVRKKEDRHRTLAGMYRGEIEVLVDMLKGGE